MRIEAEFVEISEIGADDYFVDIIPAEKRYKSAPKALTSISGLEQPHTGKLIQNGITNTHILADIQPSVLSDLADATTEQAEEWVNEVPKATIYDNEDGVWMNIVAVKNQRSPTKLLEFIGSISGKNKPYDGDTVRFYNANNPPEGNFVKTNTDKLTLFEIELLYTMIDEHLPNINVENTPYAEIETGIEIKNVCPPISH